MEKVAKKVLSILNKNGYKAYIVGGFVRDYLLNIKSYDIDICTDALPEKIIELFPKYSSENYGVIKYKIDKFNIEIATMRKELKYENRRPIEVEYVNFIEEDYLRRDFTINAIYMDIKGKIYDPCNGINDLKNKKLITVKDADISYKEDPLRILRAIRFASKYDLNIDNETLKQIKNNNKLVLTLSKERITEELLNIFKNNIDVGIGLLSKTELDKILDIKYNKIKSCNNIYGNLAQIECPYILLSNSEKQLIDNVKNIIMLNRIDNFMLFNYGLEVCIIGGDIIGINQNNIKKLYNGLPIKSINDIKVNGRDIMKWLNIKPSKTISEIIGDIKKSILNGTLNNSKKEIETYVVRKWKHE